MFFQKPKLDVSVHQTKPSKVLSALKYTGIGVLSFQLTVMPLVAGIQNTKAKGKANDKSGQTDGQDKKNDGPFTLVKKMTFQIVKGCKIRMVTTMQNDSTRDFTFNMPEKMLQEVTGKNNAGKVGMYDVIAKESFDNMYVVFFKYGFVVAEWKNGKMNFASKKTASVVSTAVKSERIGAVDISINGGAMNGGASYEFTTNGVPKIREVVYTL